MNELTVGQLKEFLKNVDDNKKISVQVVEYPDMENPIRPPVVYPATNRLEFTRGGRYNNYVQLRIKQE